MEIADPVQLRRRIDTLNALHVRNQRESERCRKRRDMLSESLDLAPQVEETLQHLSNKLFEEFLRTLEEKISIALQEVLDQPLSFKVTPKSNNNVFSVDFHVERDGNSEDIMKGQGGSVP